MGLSWQATAAGREPRFANPVPDSRPAEQVARDHLRSRAAALGLTRLDLESLRADSTVPSRGSGITHFYFRQTHGGLDVINRQLGVHVASDGRVVSASEQWVPGLARRVNASRPALDARQALTLAGNYLGLPGAESAGIRTQQRGPDQRTVFLAPGLAQEEVPVQLVLFAHDDGSVRLGWDLKIYETSGDHYWHLVVDAVTGSLLWQVDWVANDDSYQVFAIPKESPTDGARTLATNPADSLASPYGWHDSDGQSGPEYYETRGNNVTARLDAGGNNSSTNPTAAAADLNFSFPLDLTAQQPGEYADAAITNLFYWNNVLHDVLYRYGFDEASGNFQENNYNRGGAGGDSVNADAQDGSGTNNANFATPPDGSPPRMQMFTWTGGGPDAELLVASPASVAGSYPAQQAAFGPGLNSTGLSGTLEYVNDGSTAPSQGCTTLQGFTAGNIAVVDRGGCEFGLKALNAQQAGATGVVVASDVDALTTMGAGAVGNQVTIPAILVYRSTGDALAAAESPTGTMRGVAGGLNRDSDLDNGIIAHEYCHGLSIRLTGGRNTSSCLSGSQQGGEGWSDFCGLFLTGQAGDTGATPRGIGTYVLYQPRSGGGIRPYRYSTDLSVNPMTYQDLANGTEFGQLSVPHGVGSVWATTLWEMLWALVDKHGFDPDRYAGTGGNNLAMQLVVDGLKLQPCNPTFLDARDAILLADQNNNGGANQCEIWSAFAKRGMGVSASDGGTASSLSVTEAFDLPVACQSSEPPPTPTGVASTATAFDTIEVSWSAVTAASGFLIESRGGGEWSEAGLAPEGATLFVHTGLLAETEYEHRVIAYNAAGDSAPSAIVRETTPAQPTEAYSTASSQFTAAGTVMGGLSATWAIDGERQSLTEVRSGGKPSSRYSLLEHEWVIGNVPPGPAYLSITASAPVSSDGDTFVIDVAYNGQGYPPSSPALVFSSATETTLVYPFPAPVAGEVRVRVRDGDRQAGNTSLDTFSVNEVVVVTDLSGGGGDPPASPSGLGLIQKQPGTITLGWTDESAEETGFRIERRLTGSQDWVEAGLVGPDVTVFVDATVGSNISYDYQVKAYNFAGDSAPAGPLTVVSDIIELLLSANGYKIKGYQYVDLTWSGASSGVYLFRNGENIAGPLSGTTFTDQRISKGAATYQYRACKNAAGSEGCSNVVTVVF